MCNNICHEIIWKLILFRIEHVIAYWPDDREEFSVDFIPVGSHRFGSSLTKSVIGEKSFQPPSCVNCIYDALVPTVPIN